MIVLAAPSMLFYFSGHANDIKDFRSLIVSFSIGNIGESVPACNHAGFAIKTNATTSQP